MVAHVVRHLGDTSIVTFALGSGTIAVLLVFQRVAPQVPSVLLIVVGGILVAWCAHLDEHGVAVIAKVPSGLPTPIVPNFDLLMPLP